MVGMSVILVFVIPSIFTVTFGAAVLTGVLGELDRELNLWPGNGHDSSAHGVSTISVLGQDVVQHVNGGVQLGYVYSPW